MVAHSMTRAMSTPIVQEWRSRGLAASRSGAINAKQIKKRGVSRCYHKEQLPPWMDAIVAPLARKGLSSTEWMRALIASRNELTHPTRMDRGEEPRIEMA